MDEQLKLLFDKYRAAGNSETPEQFLEAKSVMGDEKFYSFVNTQIDVKKKVDPQSSDQAIVPETVVDQLQGNPINQEDQRFAQTVTEPLQPINVNQNSTELASTLATPSTELDSTQPISKDKYRNDGSLKGKGFLGTIKSNKGYDMTEYSLGVEIDNKEVDIPLLVPTLNKEELEYLKTEPNLAKPYNTLSKSEKTIVDKAFDYANERKSKNLPFFATNEEEGKFSILESGKKSDFKAIASIVPKTSTITVPGEIQKQNEAKKLLGIEEAIPTIEESVNENRKDSIASDFNGVIDLIPRERITPIGVDADNKPLYKTKDNQTLVYAEGVLTIPSGDVNTPSLIYGRDFKINKFGLTVLPDEFEDSKETEEALNYIPKLTFDTEISYEKKVDLGGENSYGSIANFNKSLSENPNYTKALDENGKPKMVDDSFVFKIKTQDELDRANEENAKLATQIDYHNRDIEAKKQSKVQRVNDLAVFETEKKSEQIKKFGEDIVNKYDGIMTPEEVEFEEDAILINNLTNQGYDINQANLILLQRKKEATEGAIANSTKWAGFISDTAQRMEESRKNNSAIDLGENTFTASEKQAWSTLAKDPEFGKYMDGEGKIFFGDVDSGLEVNSSSSKLRKQIVDKFLIWKSSNDADYRDIIAVKDTDYKRKTQAALSSGDLETANQLREKRRPIQQSIGLMSEKISATEQSYSDFNNYFDTLKKKGEDAAREYAGYQNGDVADVLSYTSKSLFNGVFNVATDIVGGVISTAGLLSDNIANGASAFQRESENPFGILTNGISDKFDTYEKDGKRIEIRFGNAFRNENGKLIFDEGLTNNLKDVKEKYNFVKSGTDWNIAATSSMVVEQGLMMLLPELAASKVGTFAASSARLIKNSAKVASYFGESSTIGKAAVNYTKYVQGATSSLVWGEQVFAQNVETGKQAGLDNKQAWAYGLLQSIGTMALIHVSPDSKIFNSYKEFNANAFKLISQNKWEEFKTLSTQAAKTILKGNVREGLQESTEQSFMYGVNAIYNKVAIEDKDKKLSTGTAEEWGDMLKQTAIVTTFLGSVGLARGGKLGLSNDTEKLAQYIVASQTEGIDNYLDEVQNSSWLTDRSKQVQEAKDIITTVRKFVNQIPPNSNLNISESTEVVKNLQKIDALKKSQSNTTSTGISNSIQADIDVLNERIEKTLSTAKERNLKESEENNKEEENKPSSFDDYDNDNQNTNSLESTKESEEGKKLYHVSNTVLSLDDVSVDPRRSRQSKRATSGGFYTYDNKEDVQKFGARNKSSNVHEITLNPGVEIKDYDGSVERLYADDLDRLRKEGYQVIRGKSVFGKDEIVVIDKSAIKSIEMIGDKKSESNTNIENNETQATTETEQSPAITTEPLNEIGNTTTENNISSEIEDSQVAETKLDESLFDDEVELDEEKQATASVQLDDAISLLESFNNNQNEATPRQDINGNGNTESEPNSVYENGQGGQSEVGEITTTNGPATSEGETKVESNSYTRNGKTYTQDEDGDFYTNDKNGKSRKVTNRSTVNDLKELSNARREESLVSSKEQNGYTYKKYADGSEVIITPKGKEVSKNFTRKIDRNRSKTVANGNFSKLYADIFGEETNAQVAKTLKAERDIALRNFVPRNAYEYALLYFANGGKVSPESVKKEVTGKDQKITNYKWAWFTKGNNTTSFENIGEIAYDSDEFSHLESNEIRSEAIDIVRTSANVRELQDKVMEIYYGRQEGSHNGMSLQEQEEYLSGMSPEELYDFNKSFLSPKELSLLEATESEASLDESELLEYYQNLFENHINSLSNEEQDELYTKPTNQRTDESFESESESVSGSEKQSSNKQEGNANNSPEYKELLKQKAEKEDEVKSAKENLDRVSKSTNRNFQDDQEDLFGERKSEDNNSLFDERADADAGKEVIQKAKERHDAAKKDLAETNARIKDFESGKTNGTSEIQFQETKQSFPTLAKEAFDSLIDRLKKPFAKAFKNLNVTTDLDAAKKRAKELGEDISQLEFKTKNGNVYGFKLSDGTIYLDPTKINANTAIHEFSHLWEQLMPSAWKKGLEIFKQTNTGKKLFDQLKKEGNYSELSDEQIWSEALNTHLGNEGATEYNRSPKGKMAEFKEWVKKAFARLGTALGIKTSPETSLQEFTQNVLGDLLGGKPIISESNQSNNTGIQYSANGVNKRAMPKSTFAKIVNAIKTEGKEKGFEELENSVWFKSLEASKKDGITVDNFHQLVLEQAKIIQENDAIKKKEALDKAKEKKDEAVAKEKEKSKEAREKSKEQIQSIIDEYKEKIKAIKSSGREKVLEQRRALRVAVKEIKAHLTSGMFEGRFTNAETNRLIRKASEIGTRRDLQKAVKEFNELYDSIKAKAESREKQKQFSLDEYNELKDIIRDLKDQGYTLSEIIDKVRELKLNNKRENVLNDEYKQQIDNIFKTLDNENMTPEEAYNQMKDKQQETVDSISDNRTIVEKVRANIRKIITMISDRQYTTKKLLEEIGATNTVNRIIAMAGSSSRAKDVYSTLEKRIFGDLKLDEKKELNAMIIAKRILSIEKNRADRGLPPIKHPYDNPAQALVEMESRLGTEKFKNLENRADDYFKAFKDLLTEMKNNGLISQEGYDSMIDIDYQPRVFIDRLLDAHGKLAEDGNVKNFNSQNGGLKSEITKALDNGSDSAIIDNAEWLLKTALSSRYKAMAMNEVNRRFMTDEYLQAKDRFDLIDPDSFKNKSEKRFYEYFKELQSKIKDNPIIGATDSGNPKYKYDTAPQGFTKAYYYVNGVRNEFYLADDLHAEWHDVKEGYISPEAKNVIGTLSGSKLIKAMATGYNPTFAFANTPRDFMQALVFSQEYSNNLVVGTFQLAYGQIQAVKRMFKSDYMGKEDEVLSKYIAYGGGMDFLHVQGLNDKDSKIGKAIDKVVSNNIFETATLLKLSKWSETMTRMAIFEKSIENQLKELGLRSIDDVQSQRDKDDIYYKAVASARGIMDFNQGGKLVKDLDAVMPYLNAATQGTRVAIDSFRKNPKQTTSRMFQAAGLMASTSIGISYAILAAARQIGDDDDKDKDKTINQIILDTYEGLSQAQRSGYINIVLPYKNDKGEHKVFKIAKTQFVAPLTYMMEEGMLGVMRRLEGKPEKDFKDIIKETAWSANRNMTPIEFGGPVDMVVGNTTKNPVIKAALTYETGYDFFKDDFVTFDIKKSNFPKELEGYKDNNIENFYKGIGSATGASPARTKAMVESIITSPDTNPFVTMMYGGADLTNAIIQGNSKSEVATELKENISKVFTKRLIGEASDYNRMRKERARVEKEVEEAVLKDEKMKVETDVLAKKYTSGKISIDQVVDEVIKMKLDNDEAEIILKRLDNKIKGKASDSRIYDIKYSTSTSNTAKAILIKNYFPQVYENSIDGQAIREELKQYKIFTKDIQLELVELQTK